MMNDRPTPNWATIASREAFSARLHAAIAERDAYHAARDAATITERDAWLARRVVFVAERAKQRAEREGSFIRYAMDAEREI